MVAMFSFNIQWSFNDGFRRISDSIAKYVRFIQSTDVKAFPGITVNR